MRAFALTKSKAFFALIFFLSLGPLAVNIVRVLRYYREFSRFKDVILPARYQAQLVLAFSGYVDPVFGCLALSFSPSEPVYIG